MDKIETLGSSTIQHGPDSSRIYLMKLSRIDMPGILRDLNSVAFENKYTKIFAKIPSMYEAFFLDDGYVKEAGIKGFYNDLTDVSFVSKFLSDQRQDNRDRAETEKNLEIALKKEVSSDLIPLENYTISRAAPEDCAEIADVFRQVFETYPFPIHDENYIKQTMKENIVYFKAVNNKKIAAVSSAETYSSWQAVEMTDFATLPDHLGKGLAFALLKTMEEEMKQENYKTSYTIARSLSPGMNITFAKAGYKFCGTLINNTNISGSIQNMNVWSRKL
ncbi:MAG: putative beta-lysine N-acetyltransferase [Candidatus Goldiibacteriota bacterium]